MTNNQEMKILVVRFKFIGDVLLSSTLCASLRASFPDAQIDYLMHANAAALFEGNPDIDNILTLSPADRKSLAYFRKIWHITRANYDIIIDATSTAKTEMISLLSPRSSYKIGRYKKGRGLFYTHKIAKQFNNKIDQRMAMLKPLMDDGFQIVEDRQLKAFLSESENAAMQNRISVAGIDQKKKLFAFSVSSKFEHRYWNLDYMEEVVQHCLAQHNAQILLLPGMAHEQQLVDRFHQRFDGNANVYSTVEADSLRELCALLKQCDIFVGNEGGPRHFAQAVGLPTVCVFSPSAKLNEWLPELSSRHQAVEWRTVFSGTVEPEYTNGDATYGELYDLIRPSHLIALVDDAVAKHL
ncbi:MAG: ADP-heptose:LPS heptosyltransferase [Arenicella sp.]|jgi:ADP-heptose:LPS heptosyltransferase